MAMPTGLWSRTRAAAPRRTGTRAGATCRAVQLQPGPELHRGRRDAQVARVRLLQLHDGWRECGSCNCMTEWNYDGDADGVMESYEGCSATADWDQSWCYVQGGSNCNQALNSTVAGETRKWRECGSCNCMTEWNYDGDADGVMESYEGCSATADWDQSWCYVQGGSNCNQAVDSTVAGETRKWRECGSCNCMTEWNYDGDADGVMESYEGCSATADWDQSWCYVQGGSNCNQALNSTVAGETRKWRECGSCNCMTEWNYDGDADGVMESYEGCSATADWDQSWCYVQGGSNCNQALNSTVAGETRKWRECGSCNCMTEWNYDGDADGVMESYEGCSATADWNQSWCYVQGGSNCNQALDSTVSGETRKWLECTPSTPSPTPAPDIESASGVGEPTMTAAIIAVILSTACA
ncbi:unnamed protein product [Prorocentrum cordatum]|uniref:Cellulase n=2 Tax=Prorocentrum cordatum TaxID=2364126 RepID=A0ABN9PAP5_9DINO|nr:unnamed protein product [Polarella glacialis]